MRPVNAPQGDEPSAVLARLEVDAANADIAAALADLAKLPDKVRAPAAAWIEKAQGAAGGDRGGAAIRRRRRRVRLRRK